MLDSSEWVHEKPTGGAGWAVGSNPFNHVDVGLVESSKGPFGPILKEVHPLVCLFGQLFSFRAPSKSVVGALGLEQVVLVDEDFNIRGSLASRSTLTDETVMDKASRYPVYHNCSFFSSGLRGVSFSIHFLGPDEALLVSEGATSGLKGLVVGAMDWDPLQVVPIEDLLVFNGQKKPHWGLVSSFGATELAIVLVG